MNNLQATSKTEKQLKIAKGQNHNFYRRKNPINFNQASKPLN